MNNGLEHWGSDRRGVATTRRFLLELLSFMHRYIPPPFLEFQPQLIHWRPSPFKGRSELEVKLSSSNPKVNLYSRGRLQRCCSLEVPHPYLVELCALFYSEISIGVNARQHMPCCAYVSGLGRDLLHVSWAASKGLYICPQAQSKCLLRLRRLELLASIGSKLYEPLDDCH